MKYFDQSTAMLLNSPLVPYVETYSPKTIKTYIYCIAHFSYWMTQSNIDIHHINEATINEFICGHLPSCTCTNVCRSKRDTNAALTHLLNILFEEGVLTSSYKKITPVDKELQAFDVYMDHVRGLAPKTRSGYLCIIKRLLSEQFSGKPVVISAIKTKDVRQFIRSQKQFYTTSGDFSLLISSVRGYFRYRINNMW
jgi:site-specific recombinase XerD